ncbi:unnamed protein product [Dovyalis caffra]|uniref:Uncharacterized protein n=1 Tax=Dovyalis caffra TaxID=77055 RepID=A0AAV1SST7_9ROSI|nr:unnamed protein product [Dovyalis caffra]
MESQSLRDQGSCYRCDEKWHLGHRCKNKELYVLLLSEGDDDEEDLCAVKEVADEELQGPRDEGRIRGNFDGGVDRLWAGDMRGVVLKLQGLTIVDDFLPLKLGGSDVILEAKVAFNLERVEG